MPSFWPLFDRDPPPADERTSGKDKTDTSLLDWPHHSKDPKAGSPWDDPFSGNDRGGEDDHKGIFWLVATWPARWLRAPMLGNPDLPTRATWIAVFAACQTAMSWIGGRVW